MGDGAHALCGTGKVVMKSASHRADIKDKSTLCRYAEAIHN